MNNDARDKLIFELEHLLKHKPAMGTLLMTVRQTRYMLVATLKNDIINLSYPREGWFDILRTRRFVAFCRARGFPVQRELWRNTRVRCAPIGSVAIDAAQTIAECFSTVYRLSGPFGVKLQGFGWTPSDEVSKRP